MNSLILCAAIALSPPLVGCMEGPTAHGPAVQQVTGRVSFATRAAQATLGEVANAATVSLIDQSTGNTVTASITDASGNFVLTFPTFTPQRGVPYVLEAVKGLAVSGTSNRAGTSAVRLRSLLFWNDGWQSLTNTTLNAGIVVSAATTAVATVASLKRQAGVPVTLSSLIGTVSGSTFSETGTGLSNASDFTPVFGFVSNAVALDQDPLRAIAYDKASGTYSLATAVPWISGYAPKTPIPGGTVTVTGGNFERLTGRNLFYFGAIPASTWSVSADRSTATVTVPANAFSAPFTLLQPNGLVQTIAPFLTLKGTVGTLVGNGVAGWWDAVGTNAQLNGPFSMIRDASGNTYWSDEYGHRIRKVSPDGLVTTLAGDGTMGLLDGTGLGARFNYPCGLALDGEGNLLLAAYVNHSIRRISPTGVVTTLAGNGSAGYVDGVGSAARFSSPVGMVRDGAGNLYVGDSGNYRVRKISAAGVVSTIAGNAASGSVDGVGSAARFNSLYGMTLDASGTTLYIADNISNKILKVVLSTGQVMTYAGTGAAGYADGAATTTAILKAPHGVAFDAAGNLYVADTSNYRIRKIDPTGTTVSTVAGTGVSGYADGPIATATFKDITDLKVDADGNLYVADRSAHAIRVVTP
ncbi:SMP-30/gluconolactonase/LRE family protein [bacterium]|nr:SMP-30/gluconolactonase/LRE family protein [bacterium]